MENTDLIAIIKSSPVESPDFRLAIVTYEKLTAHFDELEEEDCELADEAYCDLCARFGEKPADLEALARLIGPCRVFRIFVAHTEAVLVCGFEEVHRILTDWAKDHIELCGGCFAKLAETAVIHGWMCASFKRRKRKAAIV
jgi:hypothetical protein